ncbi:MAG: hypothetical protein E3J83_05070 [Candidatus Atribacteria bacterium]|nr:MAG: hypothetical protein E3J83_05070 [Candidatus Atribacteria bacterium]
MKKLILILIFSIILISFASTQQQSLGPVKQNDCIQIIQTCSDCTYNNISRVLYPNKTVVLSNVAMTKDDTYYNYTFCNTSTLGNYIVNGYGDLGGTKTSWTYDFEVTPTGFILETSESILYIIILIVTFLLFLAFLYPAITLPYSNKTNEDGSITRITKTKYLKLLSAWFAYGFFMWFLQTLNGISSSFIKLTYLSNFITGIFTYSQLFSVGITFLILTIIFVEIWKDIILSNTIKRHGKAFMDGRLQ